MSNQLYLVMEDDQIPYEGTSWPIAGFTDKDAAEAYADAKTATYLADFDYAVAQGKLSNAEKEAWPDNITQEEEGALYDALWKKYPDTCDEWESKHSFYVYRMDLPLNPIV
jgi:hypothetical protein